MSFQLAVRELAKLVAENFGQMPRNDEWADKVLLVRDTFEAARNKGAIMTDNITLRKAAQQAKPVTWDKPSTNFNEWWDGDRRRDNANPFTTDSFASWAWEGWQAALAQRPWQGLTKEYLEQIDTEEIYGVVGNHITIAMAVEAKLKELNK